MTHADRQDFDGVVIIGGGLAGLSAALAAAPRPVILISAAPLGDGAASGWAQGGVAAALRGDDDPALHAADTRAAGAGLCEADPVDILTREGPDAVRWLAGLGAPFDRTADGAFVQSLEAAHSRARVARVGGDGAGRAIMTAVIAAARAATHIDIREGVQARAILIDREGRARGVLVRNSLGGLSEIVAPATILATGGLGGLYAVTTDPAGVRGEGLALAALAGARIVDAEFVQFHPTAIDIAADPAPLATEALRGEGARLVNADGRPFMDRYDAAGELAPRDIVARAIAFERLAGRGAFLDAREAIGEAFPRHFPLVFASCMAAGLDPRREAIPVQPAAHYHMGGVATDASGATSVPSLFAAGECASTGVHGANRLASNSLLEAVVFGRRAGRAAGGVASPWTRPLPVILPHCLPHTDLTNLRLRMARDAGVVRDGQGLGRLIAWLGEMDKARGRALPLIAARLVVEAALARRESRGAHFRSDYPTVSAEANHSVQVLPAAAADRRRAA